MCHGFACKYRVEWDLTASDIQKILVGRAEQEGTGAIPKDAIAELVSARGTPDLLDMIRINHRAASPLSDYASGREKLQGGDTRLRLAR